MRVLSFSKHFCLGADTPVCLSVNVCDSHLAVRGIHDCPGGVSVWMYVPCLSLRQIVLTTPVLSRSINKSYRYILPQLEA